MSYYIKNSTRAFKVVMKELVEHSMIFEYNMVEIEKKGRPDDNCSSET